jgi:hypothetical protein
VLCCAALRDTVTINKREQNGGNSLMVSFIEYICGRQSGIYRPPFPAAPIGYRDVQSQEPKKIASPSDTFQEEFWKEKARIAARKDSLLGW